MSGRDQTSNGSPLRGGLLNDSHLITTYRYQLEQMRSKDGREF